MKTGKRRLLMNINRYLLLLVFSLIPALVLGQADDFGIWYGINAEHKLIKKLDLKLSSDLRTFDNASRVDQGFIEGGLAYKISDFLSAAASYRFTGNLEDDSRYHIRHKWFSELKGSLPLKDFNLSARLMFQVMKRTYYEDENDKIPDYTGRTKLKASYKTPKFPVNPYLSIETFSPLFAKSKVPIDKERLSAGLEYKISKKHAIETGYILERFTSRKKNSNHIVSLTYDLSF